MWHPVETRSDGRVYRFALERLLGKTL
jgi:hypothetical protein